LIKGLIHFYFDFKIEPEMHETLIKDRGSFDQKSVDRNCVLSVDRNFDNQLTKILDGFQLIESFNNEFDQTPKI
jgi:hypothetical protein